MPRLAPSAATLACALFAASAAAQVRVAWQESAPTDRLTIVNEGACAFDLLVLRIDLRPAAGDLLLDLPGGTAGLNVAQPVRAEAGPVRLAAEAVDGDRVLALELGPLAPGEAASLTLDLDDLSGGGATRVRPAALSGAAVVVTLAGGLEIRGAFEPNGEAVAPASACTG